MCHMHVSRQFSHRDRAAASAAASCVRPISTITLWHYTTTTTTSYKIIACYASITAPSSSVLKLLSERVMKIIVASNCMYSYLKDTQIKKKARERGV